MSGLGDIERGLVDAESVLSLLPPAIASALRLGGGATSGLALRVRFDGEVLASLEIVRLEDAGDVDADPVWRIVVCDVPMCPDNPSSYWYDSRDCGRRAGIRADLGRLATEIGLDVIEVPPPTNRGFPPPRILWTLDPTLPGGVAAGAVGLDVYR